MTGKAQDQSPKTTARWLYSRQASTTALEIRTMFDLVAVQESLKEFRLDGWLFYDFRGANVLARRVLGLDQKPVGSRRFFYYVPASGEPRKLVHRIETAALDSLPGEKAIYLRWQDLEAGVARLLEGSKRVAMEYAPRVSNPYVSRVDAGTIELVRSCGVELVSSGDLIQRFEATWDDEQWQMHKDAEKVTIAAYDVAWGLIRERMALGRHGSGDGGSSGDHGPFPPPRPDDLQPADRRRRTAQRRPALRADRRERTRRSGRTTSCWSTSGPSSTGHDRSTAT